MSNLDDELERIVEDAQMRHQRVELNVQPDGTVVIPAEMVAELRLPPGARCEITSDGYNLTLRRVWVKPEPGAAERMVARLRGSATKLDGMSTDEVIKLMRGN